MRGRSWKKRKNQGLVLSGGGSRASFHIGALRYLYDKSLIAPDSIVGTSAGSIVATILAQFSNPDDQQKALLGFEEIWMAMTEPSDMFAEQAWFATLRDHWEGLSDLLTPSSETPDQTESGTAIDPDSIAAAMTKDPSRNVSLPASAIWQIIGALPRLGRAGASLATSLKGAELAASAYRPGAVVHRLLFESDFQPTRVKDSGVVLRLAFVDLNSSALRYMRQDGVIVDRHDQPINGQEHDITLGIWASCALPGIFRPVKIGEEVYVDGGVREDLPVEIGMTHLGMARPVVIAASPSGLPPEDFSNKDMATVMLRVVNIMLDETLQDEVAWARQAGAHVIEPRVDVHDALTVEPALLQINRDYGWICAAEAVTNASQADKDRNDQIIQARCQWAALIKEDSESASKTRDAQVVDIRVQLSQLLAQANPALLPPNYQDWPNQI